MYGYSESYINLIEEGLSMDQLQDMAQQWGIDALSPSRLQSMASIQYSLRESVVMGNGRCFFDKTGIQIVEDPLPPGPKPMTISDARIHFVPKVGSELVVTPQPKRRSPLLLGALYGLQHYVMLTERGYFPRPEVIVGEPDMDNVAMRSVAYRIGFTASGDEIAVSYDTLEQHLFSPESKRLQALLEGRLATVE